MSDIAVILADTQGGLAAVADAAGGLQIIDGTVQRFDAIETYSDPMQTPASSISSGKPGWIALAR